MATEVKMSELLAPEDYEDLSLFFKVFSDVTRLRIIHVLSLRQMRVNDIVECLQISQSAVSHQLATLRRMRLVRTCKQGKYVYYELNDHHIMEIYNAAVQHVKE